jgi:hypothetical protein
MSKKFFTLISGITSGVALIAEAVTVYTAPSYQLAICSCIPVIEGAIITCCGYFVKEAE